MKYLRTYESYRSNNLKNEEPVNEEIFGAIGKLLGGIFKKAKERINKTKGGKEVEAIYQKYLGLIDKDLARVAKVELNLAAAARQAENPEATPAKPAEAKKESLSTEKLSKINEADDAPAEEVDAKTAATQLKAKKTVLDQLVKKYKEMAMKEMDLVLKKFGGAAKNPQLEIIINAKKDQFDLDFMNAQINYLEKAGDKTASAAIVKQRDVVAKKIEADFKDFDNKKAVEYKVGDVVTYILKDKKADWDKLTPEEKAKPNEGKAAELTASNKITAIDGDKYTFETESGEKVEKTGADLVGKKVFTKDDFKVGDRVKFKRDSGEEAEAEITKVEGDKWYFQGKDKELSKPYTSIIGKATEAGE